MTLNELTQEIQLLEASLEAVQLSIKQLDTKLESNIPESIESIRSLQNNIVQDYEYCKTELAKATSSLSTLLTKMDNLEFTDYYPSINALKILMSTLEDRYTSLLSKFSELASTVAKYTGLYTVTATLYKTSMSAPNTPQGTLTTYTDGEGNIKFNYDGDDDWNIINESTNNVWITLTIIQSNGTYGAWTEPIRMSGLDGNGYEYVYYLSDHVLTDLELDALKTGMIPTNWYDMNSEYQTTLEYASILEEERGTSKIGWYDNPCAITAGYPKLYVSVRTYKYNSSYNCKMWSLFTTPITYLSYNNNYSASLDNDSVIIDDNASSNVIRNVTKCYVELYDGTEKILDEEITLSCTLSESLQEKLEIVYGTDISDDGTYNTNYFYLLRIDEGTESLGTDLSGYVEVTAGTSTISGIKKKQSIAIKDISDGSSYKLVVSPNVIDRSETGELINPDLPCSIYLLKFSNSSTVSTEDISTSNTYIELTTISGLNILNSYDDTEQISSGIWSFVPGDYSDMIPTDDNILVNAVIITGGEKQIIDSETIQQNKETSSPYILDLDNDSIIIDINTDADGIKTLSLTTPTTSCGSEELTTTNNGISYSATLSNSISSYFNLKRSVNSYYLEKKSTTTLPVCSGYITWVVKKTIDSKLTQIASKKQTVQLIDNKGTSYKLLVTPNSFSLQIDGSLDGDTINISLIQAGKSTATADLSEYYLTYAGIKEGSIQNELKFNITTETDNYQDELVPTILANENNNINSVIIKAYEQDEGFSLSLGTELKFPESVDSTITLGTGIKNVDPIELNTDYNVSANPDYHLYFVNTNNTDTPYSMLFLSTEIGNQLNKSTMKLSLSSKVLYDSSGQTLGYSSGITLIGVMGISSCITNNVLDGSSLTSDNYIVISSSTSSSDISSCCIPESKVYGIKKGSLLDSETVSLSRKGSDGRSAGLLMIIDNDKIFIDDDTTNDTLKYISKFKLSCYFGGLAVTDDCTITISPAFSYSTLTLSTRSESYLTVSTSTDSNGDTYYYVQRAQETDSEGKFIKWYKGSGVITLNGTYTDPQTEIEYNGSTSLNLRVLDYSDGSGYVLSCTPSKINKTTAEESTTITLSLAKCSGNEITDATSLTGVSYYVSIDKGTTWSSITTNTYSVTDYTYDYTFAAKVLDTTSEDPIILDVETVSIVENGENGINGSHEETIYCLTNSADVPHRPLFDGRTTSLAEVVEKDPDYAYDSNKTATTETNYFLSCGFVNYNYNNTDRLTLEYDKWYGYCRSYFYNKSYHYNEIDKKSGISGQGRGGLYWTTTPEHDVCEDYPYLWKSVREITYDSDNNPQYGDFSTPILDCRYGTDGTPGSTGYPGCVTRMFRNTLEKDCYYHNDNNLPESDCEDRTRYLDYLVVKEVINNETKYRAYICTKTNKCLITTSDGDTIKSSTVGLAGKFTNGTDWVSDSTYTGTYWKAVSNMSNSGFFESITALSGYIQLFSTAGILLKDAENQTTFGGMTTYNTDESGNEIAVGNHSTTERILWMNGGDRGENANFYVQRNGLLHAENAEITGKINATSGTFSGDLDGASGTFSGTIDIGDSSGKEIKIDPETQDIKILNEGEEYQRFTAENLDSDNLILYYYNSDVSKPDSTYWHYPGQVYEYEYSPKTSQLDAWKKILGGETTTMDLEYFKGGDLKYFTTIDITWDSDSYGILTLPFKAYGYVNSGNLTVYIKLDDGSNKLFKHPYTWSRVSTIINKNYYVLINPGAKLKIQIGLQTTGSPTSGSFTLGSENIRIIPTNSASKYFKNGFIIGDNLYNNLNMLYTPKTTEGELNNDAQLNINSPYLNICLSGDGINKSVNIGNKKLYSIKEKKKILLAQDLIGFHNNKVCTNYDDYEKGLVQHPWDEPDLVRNFSPNVLSVIYASQDDINYVLNQTDLDNMTETYNDTTKIWRKSYKSNGNSCVQIWFDDGYNFNSENIFVLSWYKASDSDHNDYSMIIENPSITIDNVESNHNVIKISKIHDDSNSWIWFGYKVWYLYD